MADQHDPLDNPSTRHGKTLIILNPNAGGGRAGRLWKKIEPLLWQELGELVIAVTQRIEDVAVHLDKARAVGLTRVIAIGGDGTNYALVNEIVRLNRQYPAEPHMTLGTLPIGTGTDWARTLGIPFSPIEAVKWIKAAHPTPIDVGMITTSRYERHFLNIASVGMGGEVDRRVNNSAVRRPWTFYAATLATLLYYHPPRMTINLDGQPWYDDRAYFVAIANGQNFGHGMRIAPNARYDDGLFDIILADAVPRLRIMRALTSVYSGKHILSKDVHIARARTVEISSPDGPLGLDLDGEAETGEPVRFEVLPHALNMLTQNAAPQTP